MPEDLPVIPDPTVPRSTTRTSVTPRRASAQAAAAPSMPPPTMTTSTVGFIAVPDTSPNVSPLRRFAPFLAVASRSARGGPSSLPRDPVGARQGHPRHRGRLHGDGDEVLRLQVPDVRLAARPGDGLGLHGEPPQVVRQPPAALDRVESGRQFWVLRGDARRVPTVLEVIEETRCAAE